MFIFKGYSLIEIMTAITILGIIASIAAPEYWRLRDRDEYRANGQALFDTILDARNAALTNKICNDDNTAVRWMVYVVPNVTPANYELRCYRDDTNFTVENASVEIDRSSISLIDFNEAAAPTSTDGSGGSPHPDEMRISFFSGGVQGRLEYDDGTLTKAESVQMIVDHNNSEWQYTICFNRISGFPTFNKRGDTCQDY